MNILLTGGDGFIGQNLYKHLTKKHNVINIDKISGYDLLTCDLHYNADVVIHLAGLSGVRDSLDNPEEYWKQNVIAGQRLFDFFADTKILYASSSTAWEPWRNPYAMSKYSLEQIAPENSLGMRFTTVYGPNAKSNMLIPKMLKNDVQYINTNHKRDFIHVDDIISAIDILMIENVRGVVDIGTGHTHELVDLVDYFHIDCERKMGGENERLDNKADITTLNRLGWKPKVNLYNYLKENRNVN
ncbi:MAG: hypothetical protein CBD57_03165 [Candidatus Pelagibacter sp. TMED197]|jgi:UDP-glucuronate 4-epimerase|nr:MAG: hypothetical protein CBD57_03165 [Candidatus Pelagibacter sp. TMED197]|tara:strand:+ start:1543 stop:2271 length:729 start_codon:yes stop_codon:yes gene_type:complete